jgi:peptide-methionine (S)-S-oxide reductase
LKPRADPARLWRTHFAGNGGSDLKRAGHAEITTEIEPAPPFYYAEDYHQQYLHKNPNGYRCHSNTGAPFPADA